MIFVGFRLRFQNCHRLLLTFCNRFPPVQHKTSMEGGVLTSGRDIYEETGIYNVQNYTRTRKRTR
jgi:hypothetical protein